MIQKDIRTQFNIDELPGKIDWETRERTISSQPLSTGEPANAATFLTALETARYCYDIPDERRKNVGDVSDTPAEAAISWMEIENHKLTPIEVVWTLADAITSSEPLFAISLADAFKKMVFLKRGFSTPQERDKYLDFVYKVINDRDKFKSAAEKVIIITAIEVAVASTKPNTLRELKKRIEYYLDSFNKGLEPKGDVPLFETVRTALSLMRQYPVMDETQEQDMVSRLETVAGAFGFVFDEKTRLYKSSQDHGTQNQELPPAYIPPEQY